MRTFMDYIVQSAFYRATGWSQDNSYSSLNATSSALLDFEMPRGLRLTLSSLATPQFATSYHLGTVGVVDGSIAYLYSTSRLDDPAVAHQSDRVPLPELLRSYRPLVELPRRAAGADIPGWNGAPLRPAGNTLAYGRLYLPASMLEALLVRRISRQLQVQVSSVSDRTLRNGGTVLGMIQYDEGRFGMEGLASSDGGLIGFRGLYNFGGDVANLGLPGGGGDEGRHGNANANANGTSGGVERERERIYGRFSSGAELYYGTLNKSGGMSLGMRFATLPTHKGTPLTATMTINPLMGNISWNYAVMAGDYCSLATRMGFNVYSYESDWAVGMELWRKKGAWSVTPDDGASVTAPVEAPRSFQAKMEWRLDEAPVSTVEVPKPLPVPAVEKKRERSFEARLGWRLDEPVLDQPISESKDAEDDYSGVLKARLDQHLRIGLLWEGRVKSLLFSLGSEIDLRRVDSPFRTLGMEVQFSS